MELEGQRKEAVWVENIASPNSVPPETPQRRVTFRDGTPGRGIGRGFHSSGDRGSRVRLFPA
jgi:hypothetical protein